MDIHEGSTEGWMETFTGKRFYSLNPKAEDVDIIDIAHSLSNQCRYGGHTNIHYSVATHCCVLSDYMRRRSSSRRDALIALMHDAGEAYLSDIVRPIKHRVTQLKEVEAAIDRVVFEAFSLPAVLPQWLKLIDSQIINDERSVVMSDSGNDWSTSALEPLGVVIPAWAPTRAKFEFLLRFYQLIDGMPQLARKRAKWAVPSARFWWGRAA
jgi:hypothetical protein